MFLMPQHHAGQRFDLHVGHGGFLHLGEAADLVLRETDIGHLAIRDLLHRRFDLAIAQAEGRGRVTVEFLGQFAHRRITASLDIAQDALDRRADLGVILRPLTGRFPALEILRHDRPPGGKWPRITGAFPIRATAVFSRL
jgi:hypothetical protein